MLHCTIDFKSPLAVALAVPISASENNRSSFFDWAGLSVIWSSIGAAAKLPANHFSFSLSIGNQAHAGSTFQWNGIQWTPELILARLSWIAVALALALLAALLFDRFDPSKERWRREAASALVPSEVAEDLPLAPKPIHALPLTPLANRQSHFRFGAILLAELRLMLKGQKWWWYAVAAGLIVACAATLLRLRTGNAIGLRVVLAGIDLVENGRARNSRPDQSAHFLCATSDCAAASSSMASRRGTRIADRKRIRWAAVLYWKLARPACMADRRALYSDFSSDLWRMSGSSKLFEIVYTLLWYVGPMHATLQLDFMGSAPGTEATRVPTFYFACAVAMAAIAILGRKRQLQT